MGKTATAFKTVTINDLEESDRGPVWVVNITSGKLRAQLVIGILDSSGKPSQVIVPQTWIPINLTEQAPRKLIVESTRFRNSIVKQHIKLISQEEADYLMTQKGAKEEFETVRQFSLDRPYEMKGRQGLEASVESSDGFDSVSLSAPVEQLIATMQNNSEESVMNTLRNMGTLRRDEYKAVYSRANELHFKELKSLCKEMAGVGR